MTQSLPATPNRIADPAHSLASGRWVGHPGSVPSLLRLEGAVALIAAVLAYRAVGGSWVLFSLLFLAPDLSMAGYLVNRRIGAFAYNLGHSYLGPALLAAIGATASAPVLFAPGLIWAAHIGFDRMVGYGLKYPEAFGATHLGWRGGTLARSSR